MFERQSIKLELPYPPSVNHYYRNIQGRTLISKDGREYAQRVYGEVLEKRSLGKLPPEALGNADLWIEIYATPPDKRVRDIDNLLKPLLDAIRKSDLIEDDRWIKDLRVVMGTSDGTGQGRVRIEIGYR